MKKILISLLVIFCIPNFVYAVWWNPTTWFNKTKIEQPTASKVITTSQSDINVATTTSVIQATTTLKNKVENKKHVLDSVKIIQATSTLNIKQLSQTKNNQSHLPPATQEQIAMIMQLCTAAKQDCDLTINAYNANSIFRSNMDILISKFAQIPKITQQQRIAQCEKVMRDALSSTIKGMAPGQSLSAEASIENSCGDPNASFTQQQAQTSEVSNLNLNINSLNQQLQNLNQSKMINCYSQLNTGASGVSTNCY